MVRVIFLEKAFWEQCADFASECERFLLILNKLLIKSFVTGFQGNCDVDASTFVGNTPLHLAAGFGLKGQTALLVAAGADTTLQNSDEETAFDLANVAEVNTYQNLVYQQS